MSTRIDQRDVSATALASALIHADSLFATTLDMLPVGIVLVDAEARIHHGNVAARAMLDLGEPIVSHHGLLRASCRVATAAFVAAMRQVALREGLEASTTSVPLPYHDGRAALAHVCRLNAPRHGMNGGWGMAVFVTQAAEHAPPPPDALARLFDLTPSEARVLDQIVLGRNRRQAAAALGVADTTVKTHLERVYAKTRTSDRLGLCRLVASLSLSLYRRRDEAEAVPLP